MIEIEHLTFAYGRDFRMHLPELKIARGEKVVLIGPSGSGKTTLLHLAAGILLPEAGRICADGVELTRQTDAARRNFRIRSIGLVFQEFELLEYLSVRENILLPYRVNRALRLTREVRASVDELARAVGIGHVLGRRPDRLSQGERQRVAISRALITRPRMIFADEPTGNLDPRTSRTIVELILQQAEAGGATVLMVTHDHSLLEKFDRVVDVGELLEADATAEVSG